jgi:apolipoprotein N-acyltransferase
MRILAVILGTFVALFGLAFGGCAVTWVVVVLQDGMPDMTIVWLIVLNLVVAVVLLRAAYRLLRGPPRRRDAPAAAPDP